MENMPMHCQSLNRDQMLSLNRYCQCVSLPAEDDIDYFSSLALDDMPSTPSSSFPDQSLNGQFDRDARKPSSNNLLHKEAAIHTLSPYPRQDMFAHTAVFITKTDLDDMQQQISAIEAVATLPGYRSLVSHRSNTSYTGPQSSTHGLLMGYDFHLTDKGPRLIEVNTNAGGAFVMHALLAGIRQRVSPCHAETIDQARAVEQKLVRMFIQEWQRSGRKGTPASVAIVDNTPEQQFLYADMLLAKAMLERNNIKTVVCTPESLSLRNGDLYHEKTKIDFVYNRCTDFYFTEPATQTLRQALLQNSAVVSPAPLHHTLFADKRNPAIWQNKTQMNQFSASAETITTLARLPGTASVVINDATELWNRRKNLFFKPNAGYGGKATYRGDKLTRKVWHSILQGGYIAQTLEPPALRVVGEGDDSKLMKFDIRIFTYNGKRLLSAARVYQGQTTNFRTPGGGFAPVVYLD